MILYLELRHKLEKLYSDMISHVSRDALDRGNRLLGIRQKNSLSFRSEAEVSILFDFLVYEQVSGKECLAEKFLRTAGDLTPNQLELLGTIIGKPTSLYRVISTRSAKSQVLVEDCLHPHYPEIMLKDKNMSQTLTPDVLVFTRILTFPGIAMTSGMVMPFPRALESVLKHKSKVLQKTIPTGKPAVAQFVTYFKLYREFGFPMEFQSVPLD